MFLLNLGHIPDYTLLTHELRDAYSPRTAIYDFIKVFSRNTWVQQCNIVIRAVGLSSWVWSRAGIFRKLLSWHG